MISRADKTPYSKPELPDEFKTEFEPVELAKEVLIVPQTNYIKNVVPMPELVENNKFFYVLRYYLFAETFIKPRAFSEKDSKDVVGIKLISRSLIQPILEEKNKEKISKIENLINHEDFYGQLFSWKMLWIPYNLNKKFEVLESNLGDKLPKSFVTIPKIIEIPENSGNLPIPEINFLMRKNSEKDIVVLRVTTPIFDLKVSK